MQTSKSEIYSVFLLQYLKGKDHTGNAAEDGRILLNISLQFVARYDVNWIYLYPERIRLLSKLDRYEGRIQRTKCWKYATLLLQLHYLWWYFTTKSTKKYI
jgi:hypothetical protein